MSVSVTTRCSPTIVTVTVLLNKKHACMCDGKQHLLVTTALRSSATLGVRLTRARVAADTADTPIMDEWSHGSGDAWANRRCEGDWPVPALPLLFGPSFSLLAALAALDSLLCTGTGIDWDGVPLPLSAGWLIGGGQIVEDGCSVGLFRSESVV